MEIEANVEQPRRATRGGGKLEAFLAQRRYRLAEKRIPEHLRSGRILDIGHGTHPLFLAQTQFRERHGIDRVTVTAIDRWRTRGLQLVNRDLNEHPSLPYPDDYFSAITMLAVFEHLQPERLVPVIAEVRRVLKKDGVFLLTTPAGWTGWLIALMSRVGLISRDEVEEHQGSYSHSQIRATLQQAGFDSVRVRLGYFELGANNWGLVTK